MKKIKLKIAWSAMLLVFTCILCPELVRGQLPEGVTVTKIWDKAEHNAFTDLIRFKGKFYCIFREGSDHAGGADGVLRILSSADGKEWEDIALLEKKGLDLRDAKLSVTPSGQIMVIIGATKYENRIIKGRYPHVSFSDISGETFSAPEKVNIDPEIVSWGDWIWRVTWYKGTGYGIDYQIGPEERRGPTALYLVKTTDGRNFTKVSKMEVDGFPNEATIGFDKDGTMHVMIRRELGDKMGVMAKSAAPFNDWQYNKMYTRLGGPNFIFGKKQRIIATTRLTERLNEKDVWSTGLLIGNKSGSFKEILRLPSSGDNSYAGMVPHGKFLWVSYYSSHEGKTSIYLAKIPNSFIKQKIKENPL